MTLCQWSAGDDWLSADLLALPFCWPPGNDNWAMTTVLVGNDLLMTDPPSLMYYWLTLWNDRLEMIGSRLCDLLAGNDWLSVMTSNDLLARGLLAMLGSVWLVRPYLFWINVCNASSFHPSIPSSTTIPVFPVSETMCLSSRAIEWTNEQLV